MTNEINESCSDIKQNYTFISSFSTPANNQQQQQHNVRNRKQKTKEIPQIELLFNTFCP